MCYIIIEEKMKITLTADREFDIEKHCPVCGKPRKEMKIGLPPIGLYEYFHITGQYEYCSVKCVGIVYDAQLCHALCPTDLERVLAQIEKVTKWKRK